MGFLNEASKYTQDCADEIMCHMHEPSGRKDVVVDEEGRTAHGDWEVL
jgi:hypothetical protein